MQKAARWPCGVCGRRVSSNSIHCSSCKKWVHNNYYNYNHFTALWTLSGTTRVSRYQKKHSPSHTYRGHQSSLICFLRLLRSFLYNLCAWQSFSTIFLQSFLWSTFWPGTLPFILHTSFHPIIAFFSQHIPIPSQQEVYRYEG